MIIDINGLSFSYQSEPILKDVSFKVQEGEICAILGMNGAGKSTLLRCINRILKPFRGEVLIDGVNINRLSRLDIAKEIGYVPQRSESAHITVFDAVLLGRKPYIKWDITESDINITKKVLETLNLEHLSLHPIEELSGGEFQKVMIGRALVQKPRILLLDEPTNNLDMKNQLEVMRIIKSNTRNNHIASIVVMHDLNIAVRYADKFLLLKEGRVLNYGGREIITTENIEQLFEISVIIENVNGIPVVIPVDETEMSKITEYALAGNYGDLL